MSQESRPPILLDDDRTIPPIYDYYDDRPPNPLLTKYIVHPLMAAVFVGAKKDFREGSKEVVDAHTKSGGQLLLAFEHESIFDPFVMAGVINRDQTYKHLRANIRVAVKPEVYGWHDIVAWFLDHAGGFPAFRVKDDTNEKLRPTGTPQEIKDRIRSAGDGVVQLAINTLDRGSNVLIFPRSERRPKEDTAPVTSDSLRLGVGRIACGVEDRQKLLVLPGAINYDRGPWRLRPSLVFGSPLEVAETATPELIVASVAMGIEVCRERAAQMSKLGRKELQ